MQKLLLVYYYSAKFGEYFQIWVFPRFGGKDGCVLSMRTQVILDSLSSRPGSAPIGGGKKGEFRDWTRMSSEVAEISGLISVNHVNDLSGGGGGGGGKG